ncbi:hypothetical protein KCP70_05855 [Salmonella enterica subsp. enterica]|nr:hypothetical protein KCP70_05855 [Salmonella enterica subsp. enterica]
MKACAVCAKFRRRRAEYRSALFRGKYPCCQKGQSPFGALPLSSACHSGGGIPTLKNSSQYNSHARSSVDSVRGWYGYNVSVSRGYYRQC